jgi:hypothetical protein
MVLFVKGTEKTVPSLGRIGSFLDKQWLQLHWWLWFLL